MSKIDEIIGTAIIDSINDDGFLTSNTDDILSSINTKGYHVEVEDVEVVRHQIQHFEPLGCGSLTLKDCLLSQIKESSDNKNYFELCKAVVRNDLDLIAKHNYPSLLKKYKINQDTLHKILDLISTLHPKPGTLISQKNTEYIIPELSTKKINNRWHVFLNPNLLPKLYINQKYASLINKSIDKNDRQFIKQNLQEAQWFLKNIQNRQNTLLKIGQYIVDFQQNFLNYGEEAMKPLTLNEVAETLGMHESTISRTVNKKYLHTPQGIFELKYFFSSKIKSNNGIACSSTAIKAIIKQLISSENCYHPLSDNKISLIINEQGIPIARRTVAKYRESMRIFPSHDRKIQKY